MKDLMSWKCFFIVQNWKLNFKTTIKVESMHIIRRLFMKNRLQDRLNYELLLHCGQCTLAWRVRTRMCVCLRASPEDWQQWGDGHRPTVRPRGRWRGCQGCARRWNELTPHSLLQGHGFQIRKKHNHFIKIHSWQKKKECLIVSSLTRLLHDVGHSTGAILTVLKGDFSLARSLHSNTEPSSSSLPRPDTELSCTRHKDQNRVKHYV